jgi:hypothetical protein
VLKQLEHILVNRQACPIWQNTKQTKNLAGNGITDPFDRVCSNWFDSHTIYFTFDFTVWDQTIQTADPTPVNPWLSGVSFFGRSERRRGICSQAAVNIRSTREEDVRIVCCSWGLSENSNPSKDTIYSRGWYQGVCKIPVEESLLPNLGCRGFGSLTRPGTFGACQRTVVAGWVGCGH